MQMPSELLLSPTSSMQVNSILADAGLADRSLRTPSHHDASGVKPPQLAMDSSSIAKVPIGRQQGMQSVSFNLGRPLVHKMPSFNEGKLPSAASVRRVPSFTAPKPPTGRSVSFSISSSSPSVQKQQPSSISGCQTLGRLEFPGACKRSPTRSGSSISNHSPPARASSSSSILGSSDSPFLSMMLDPSSSVQGQPLPSAAGHPLIQSPCPAQHRLDASHEAAGTELSAIALGRPTAAAGGPIVPSKRGLRRNATFNLGKGPSLAASLNGTIAATEGSFTSSRGPLANPGISSSRSREQLVGPNAGPPAAAAVGEEAAAGKCRSQEPAADAANAAGAQTNGLKFSGISSFSPTVMSEKQTGVVQEGRHAASLENLRSPPQLAIRDSSKSSPIFLASRLQTDADMRAAAAAAANSVGADLLPAAAAASSARLWRTSSTPAKGALAAAPISLSPSMSLLDQAAAAEVVVPPLLAPSAKPGRAPGRSRLSVPGIQWAGSSPAEPESLAIAVSRNITKASSMSPAEAAVAAAAAEGPGSDRLPPPVPLARTYSTPVPSRVPAASAAGRAPQASPAGLGALLQGPHLSMLSAAAPAEGHGSHALSRLSSAGLWRTSSTPVPAANSASTAPGEAQASSGPGTYRQLAPGTVAARGPGLGFLLPSLLSRTTSTDPSAAAAAATGGHISSPRRQRRASCIVTGFSAVDQLLQEASEQLDGNAAFAGGWDDGQGDGYPGRWLPPSQLSRVPCRSSLRSILMGSRGRCSTEESGLPLRGQRSVDIPSPLPRAGSTHLGETSLDGACGGPTPPPPRWQGSRRRYIVLSFFPGSRGRSSLEGDGVLLGGRRSVDIPSPSAPAGSRHLAGASLDGACWGPAPSSSGWQGLRRRSSVLSFLHGSSSLDPNSRWTRSSAGGYSAATENSSYSTAAAATNYSFGRVAMPHRSLDALAQSALFTATILPEQLDAEELAELAPGEAAAVAELQQQGGRVLHVDGEGNILPHETVAAVRRVASFRRSTGAGVWEAGQGFSQGGGVPVAMSSQTPAAAAASGRSTRLSLGGHPEGAYLQVEGAFVAVAGGGGGVCKAASLSALSQHQQQVQCPELGTAGIAGAAALTAGAFSSAMQLQEAHNMEVQGLALKHGARKAASFRELPRMIGGVGNREESWAGGLAARTSACAAAANTSTYPSACLEGLRGSNRASSSVGEHLWMPLPPSAAAAAPVESQPPAAAAGHGTQVEDPVILYGSALDDSQLRILHQALTTVTENVLLDDEEERLFGGQRKQQTQGRSRGGAAAGACASASTGTLCTGFAAPRAPDDAECIPNGMWSSSFKGGSCWSSGSLQQGLPGQRPNRSFNSSFREALPITLNSAQGTPRVTLRGRRATAVQCLEECMALGLLTSRGLNAEPTTTGSSVMPAWAVIPTLPSSIYEHTIAAVPNFEHKVSPKASCTFLLVNLSLIIVLIGLALTELHML